MLFSSAFLTGIKVGLLEPEPVEAELEPDEPLEPLLEPLEPLEPELDEPDEPLDMLGVLPETDLLDELDGTPEGSVEPELPADVTALVEASGCRAATSMLVSRIDAAC
ncbi:MAG TPA: hypothetical protein VGA61_02255 [Anaerolineae bacterium]